MSILFIKSILSIVMLCLATFAVFSMFEIFGRSEKRFNIEKLKKAHKINGIIYFLIFAFIAYFCLGFIVSSRTELSPRGTFHSIFALTIIVLFGVKLSIIRIYRQFYNQVKIFGLLIALITFGMFSTSGGYYLLVTKFGTDKTFNKIMEYKEKVSVEKIEEKGKSVIKVVIKTDQESIKKGKELYESKCYFCHDAYSTKTTVGPGHKDIMKNPFLPVSKKPATPENIAKQIRSPYMDMPAFSYLSEEDVSNLIAFLNTL